MVVLAVPFAVVQDVVGDDTEAKQTVSDLLAGVGFRPIHVGPLS